MSKSFKGYVPIEAPEFKLESPDGTRVLDVKCVGMLPGSRFLDFLASTDKDNPSRLAVAIGDLFRAAIRPESYDAFKAFIDDVENGVSMDLLAEIAGHLGEVYSSRPTAPSQPSSAG